MTEPLTAAQLQVVSEVVGDLLARFVAGTTAALEAEVASLRAELGSLQHQLSLWNPGRLPFDSSRNLRH